MLLIPNMLKAHYNGTICILNDMQHFHVNRIINVFQSM